MAHVWGCCAVGHGTRAAFSVDHGSLDSDENDDDKAGGEQEPCGVAGRERPAGGGTGPAATPGRWPRHAHAFKTAWADGTRQLLFEPLELLEKLAALISRPRIN